jgi:lauroyl/myristoyl acyltransferase
METFLYLLARLVIALLQALPLTVVARLGRAGGAVAGWLDARHRRVAVKNLTRCFGREKSAAEIRALVREHFRRLGENYACAVKTFAMTAAELRPHLEFAGVERLAPPPGETPRPLVVAIGHFGNFELYARFGQFAPGYQCVTTYRALRQPSLNRLAQSLRARSGCLYFERRTEAAALRAALNQPGVVLGLLADQRVARGGVRVPFFGRDCSTSTAAAVFALRYDCDLHTAVCYRIGLARWRIEVGPAIATRENSAPRPVAEIMAEVNRAFEIAVRRDPANWFWVHDRWKRAKSEIRKPKSEADSPPVSA